MAIGTFIRRCVRIDKFQQPVRALSFWIILKRASIDGRVMVHLTLLMIYLISP